MTGERALATIERVLAVDPIPDADAIEVVTVRGWKVVARKGEFEVGAPCVYIEIDSWLPVDNPAFEFLASRGVRKLSEADERKGHVLCTAKLRGQVSQGIVFSPSAFGWDGTTLPALGTDVTATLGVEKYEPPIPAELSGEVAGKFPTHLVRKTDAERVQNLADHYDMLRRCGVWYATEKIDGTSMTALRDETGTLRVCGRNWEYRPGKTADDDNTLWRLARTLDRLEPGWAIQAEVYGPGIQGNPLKVAHQRMAIFNVWRNGQLLRREQWPTWVLNSMAVPVYDNLVLPSTIEEAIEQADRLDSLVTPGRKPEGVVWHEADGVGFTELDGRACFKVISNRYLLKQKEQ